MKITRKDLSVAATSSLPLLTFLGFVNGLLKHDARLGAIFVVLQCGPLLGVRFLLALPKNLRVTRRSWPVFAGFGLVVISWALAAKDVADQQGVPQAARLPFALKTIALFGVFSVVILGINLRRQARNRRSATSGES